MWVCKHFNNQTGWVERVGDDVDVVLVVCVWAGGVWGGLIWRWCWDMECGALSTLCG